MGWLILAAEVAGGTAMISWAVWNAVKPWQPEASQARQRQQPELTAVAARRELPAAPERLAIERGQQ